MCRAGEVLKGLAKAGIVRATPDEIRALAENILLVATFWLNFNIVRTMRDPALLEYAGRDLFKVRIFPIEPRSRKPIKISYTQLLPNDTEK